MQIVNKSNDWLFFGQPADGVVELDEDILLRVGAAPQQSAPLFGRAAGGRGASGLSVKFCNELGQACY